MFDSWVIVDWSGGNDTGRRPRKDAIWLCIARDGVAEEPEYLRNRYCAFERLSILIEEALSKNERLAVGFDFPFGYPAGFCRAITGANDPMGLWEWYSARVEDSPRNNNRFDLAAEINRKITGGCGPFWGNGLKRDIDGLPRNKSGYRNPFPEKRKVETLATGSFTCWQLSGAGSVGGQVIMGLPVLAQLRNAFPGSIAVWPFDTSVAPITFFEVWPSLSLGKNPSEMIRDAWQVREVAQSWSGIADLGAQADIVAPEEGWILGVPQERIAA